MQPILSQREMSILLADLIANDKSSVVYLLQRNGVDIKENVSDGALIRAMLVAIENSERFRNELSDLITQNIVATDQQNFTDPMHAEVQTNAPGGFYNSNGNLVMTNPSPGYYQPGGDPNDPETANWGNTGNGSGGNFWDKVDSDTINSVVNFGLGALSNVLFNKQGEEKDKTLDEYQNKIKGQVDQQKGGGGRQGLSPLAIGGMVLGGIVLIGAIFIGVKAVNKKGKK